MEEMDNTNRCALVTGANSGLGFEAAAQLAEAGWDRIILACRSEEKALSARAELVKRVGIDPYATLVIDTSEVDSANAAVASLKERGERVDFLLLNAGASGKDPRPTSAGFETTYASTLVGHHVLTAGMLADDLLTSTARIVIAGSEGARSNMPGMSVHDVRGIAQAEFGGDLAAAIVGLMRLSSSKQMKYNNMNEYVTAKLVVAWWAAGVAERLPDGMTINAVSPGAALETSFARDMPAAMAMVMLPMMKLVGPLLGMAGTTEQAARRYVDAADYTAEQTGDFYATAHRKRLVGPVGVQTWPEFLLDAEAARASVAALETATGAAVP